MAVRDDWRSGSSGTGPIATAEPGPAETRWADEEWTSREEESQGGGTGLAKALGWFSLALGVAELAAPRGIARLIGVDDDDDNRRLLQALGARELATGLAILAQPDRPTWLWARVGGDVLDLAVLGSKLKSEESDRGRVTAAAAAVLGVTALDILAGQRLSARANGGRQALVTDADAGIRVRRSITLQQSPDQVYHFWRDFRNLPRFMSHLESVEVLDDRRSRWRATAPAGTTVEWEAEILEERPGEILSWRSLPGSEVDNAGSVRFVPAPGGRGTEVRVELRYDPPGGRMGAKVAKLFGEAPEQQIDGDLRRLKQVLETGEVVHSDASIHKMAHPARPPAPGEPQ
ncbi:MAG TPA: SRPBCC family protein [Gemmatimonadales bacterium]